MTIVVDALRASATLASLLERGASEVMVVAHVAEALAQKQYHPEEVVVGERDCLRVEGCDLGNSPLQGPCGLLPAPVVFTSSNCARCCVAAADAPGLYVGSTVNATALAQVAATAARELGADVLLVPAGAGEDETRFNLEDHLACGALLEALSRACPQARVGNDAARAAQALYQRVGARGLPVVFARSDHGRRLVELGFAEDVRWAAQVDVYRAVPALVEVRALPGGGRGAVLKDVGEGSRESGDASRE